jgi:hypothetical protein
MRIKCFSIIFRTRGRISNHLPPQTRPVERFQREDSTQQAHKQLLIGEKALNDITLSGKK